MKKAVLGHDKEPLLQQASQHPSLKHLIEIRSPGCWIKVWGTAMTHGHRATSATLHEVVQVDVHSYIW